jgi:hypothetical protein
MRPSSTVRRLRRCVPGIAQFIAYFERDYINGTFRPVLWNVYDRDTDTRTNNHVEGMQTHNYKVLLKIQLVGYTVVEQVLKVEKLFKL